MRTIGDLRHDELATLAREYLLAGHLIDRAGMPMVLAHGLDVMTEVAVEEWMGASPVYTPRMQRLLGFEGDTVEVACKAMQLDIGAPPEFMDFRFTVHDDHHAEFQLDHCGALMDVEPMGEEMVFAMCHDIEDPTFDATAWATNRHMTIRPIHRPPREPADRLPHCAWTLTIDPDGPENPEPVRAGLIGETRAGRLPLAVADGPHDDGAADYSGPLDADLRLERFSRATLRAMIEEIALQGHLLVLSFASALAERTSPDEAATTVARQFAGVAGVTAERLVAALGLGATADDVATAFALHPAFAPRSYVDWSVEVDDDRVLLSLRECPATDEPGIESWMGALRGGRDQALTAIAMGVDRHWVVERDGSDAGPVTRWTARRSDVAATELDDVTLTKFSTGAKFHFT
ncbi:MAG: hypothetical protein R2698_04435 [Microthrixaceae bacterium]